MKDAPQRRHVAVRERVPDDQDALEPHADIDRDRDRNQDEQRACARTATRALRDDAIAGEQRPEQRRIVPVNSNRTSSRSLCSPPYQPMNHSVA